MIYENYHTHTPRCKHARGTERQYIETAIANGYTTLGFSDHTPQPFPKDYVSGIRMPMEQLDDYVDTLLALRGEYADRIKILIGLEAEYFPAYFDQLLEELRKRPIDYLILGQHNVPDEITGFYSGQATSDGQRLQAYVELVIQAMQTGVFSYLAHPDLINFTGDPALYQKEMRRLCRHAGKLHIPLEINMLGLREHRCYPSDTFFRLAVEEGCRFIVGCDAHDPENVLQPVDEPGFKEFIERNGISFSQELKLRRF